MDPSFVAPDPDITESSSGSPVPYRRNQQAIPPEFESEPSDDFEGESFDDVEDEGDDEEDEGDDEEEDSAESVNMSTNAPVEGDTSSHMEPAPLERSGPSVDRPWSDYEDILILTGFLNFKEHQGEAVDAWKYDIHRLYKHINGTLKINFTVMQLKEKLRRLQNRYRETLDRLIPVKSFAFKEAHKQDCFEISHKIWGIGTNHQFDKEYDELPRCPDSAIIVSAGRAVDREKKISISQGKRPRIAEEEDAPACISKETMKISFLKILQEFLQLSIAGTMIEGSDPEFFHGLHGRNLSLLPYSIGASRGNMPNENWKNRSVLQLETRLKKIELTRHQLKLTLKELKAENPTPKS